MANRYPFQPPQSYQQTGIIQPNVPGFSGINMWPQHNPQQQLAEEQKQREYLKQQQRLRLMAASTHKQPVSADKLIENLLEKEDTFKPKAALPAVGSVHQVPRRSNGSGAAALTYTQPGPAYSNISAAQSLNPMLLPDVKQVPSKQQNSLDSINYKRFGDPTNMLSQGDIHKSQFQLPFWLSPQSSSFPPFYRQVWTIVGQEEGLVDTSKILPVLLTSGLSTDVLGYIWGLANQKIAGQLTEDELYIVLALVALAQNGCTFNTLNILNLVPQPLIPSLNLSTLNMTPTQGAELYSNQGKLQQEESLLTTLPLGDLGVNSLMTDMPPEAKANAEDIAVDDFSDFQSAVCETSDAVIDPTPDSTPVGLLSHSSISTESIPVSQQNYSSTHLDKFPSVLVMSNTGRGIGSRLANHSLGTPRQTKSRHHKHHHHHHHRNQQQANHNPPPPAEEEFSDFQQAKSLPSDETSSTNEMFPKCVVKTSQSKTFILKESAIRSDVKFQKTGDVQQAQISESASTVEKQNNVVSLLQLSSDKQVVLEEPHRNKSLSNVESGDTKELISIEEDKYSALRVLSLTNQSDLLVNDSLKTDHSALSDDFGDFLSAEPLPADDSFSPVTADSEAVAKEKGLQDKNEHLHLTVSSSQNVEEFKVDDWGAFESAPSTSAEPFDNWVTNIDLSREKHEINSDLVSAMVGLNLKGSDFSWDQNMLCNEKQMEGETWKSVLDSNVAKGDSWVLESYQEMSRKSNGLNFLGKIYESTGSQFSAKDDAFASEHEHQARTSLAVKDDDEFGDFVGSDTWPMDGKYSNKEVLFEIHSGPGVKDAMFDSQSVSSLELPPLALSRHGSLPSLDLKVFPPDKVGHQPWDSSPQGVEHQIREWCRCVQVCLQLLQVACTVFNSVSSDEILEEIVNAQRGRDYLYNLLEVFGICQRVKYSSRFVSADAKQLESLLAEVDTAWSNLECCYAKADITTDIVFVSGATENISDGQELSSDANITNGQEHSTCGICLTNIGTDITEHESNTCQLEYGGQMYHASCANVWVNCVDCNLPALAGNPSLL